MKHFSWKTALLIVFLLLLALGGFRVYQWMQGTMGPAQAALDALQSDDYVNVIQQTGLVTFIPLNVKPETGFILYPGAGVDFRSYAPALHQISAQGYRVFVPFMPFNLAFFNVNAAKGIIADNPEINNWAVGGHSLGGLLAYQYAVKDTDIDGMIFWASYPNGDQLIDRNIPVLSLSASLDGLATPADIDQSRVLLPSDAYFIEIQGGNHAQFGAYGAQSGDNPATISFQKQTAQIIAATVGFLDTLSKQ
jgi:dienelactone hydrolase